MLLIYGVSCMTYEQRSFLIEKTHEERIRNKLADAKRIVMDQHSYDQLDIKHAQNIIARYSDYNKLLN